MIPLEPFLAQAVTNKTHRDEQSRRTQLRDKVFPASEQESLTSYLGRISNEIYTEPVERYYLRLYATCYSAKEGSSKQMPFINYAQQIFAHYKDFRNEYVMHRGRELWSKMHAFERLRRVIMDLSPEDEIDASLQYGSADTTFLKIRDSGAEGYLLLPAAVQFLENAGDILGIHPQHREIIKNLATQLPVQEQEKALREVDSARALDADEDQTETS